MSKIRMVVVLAVLALIGLGAFRAAQVISAKKEERKGEERAVPLVEVVSVAQGLVEEKILRTGDMLPKSQVTIYSKVQGWVENINVREGDRVKEGQVLATLDVREAEASVGQARANLEAAKARRQQVRATAQETVQTQILQTQANLELAEADLKRFQELYEKNFIARQQLDEARTKYNVAKAVHALALNSLRQRTWENDLALAEAQVRQAQAALDLAQAQLANLIILSPMNGGVTKRHVDPGTMVKDTTPILTLMDLSEMKMVVNVIEKEFMALRIGLPVKIFVTAFPDRTFSGKIDVIIPALELQSRTAEIHIAVPNPGFQLKPGMFGQAEILLRSDPRAILVPIQAVFTRVNQDYVYILQGEKVALRPIRKGLVKDAAAEVLQGLTLGEKVVTAGHAALKDGAAVRLSLAPEKK